MLGGAKESIESFQKISLLLKEVQLYLRELKEELREGSSGKMDINRDLSFYCPLYLPKKCLLIFIIKTFILNFIEKHFCENLYPLLNQALFTLNIEMVLSDLFMSVFVKALISFVKCFQHGSYHFLFEYVQI